MNLRINDGKTEENDHHLDIMNNHYDKLGSSLYCLYKQIIHDVEKILANIKINNSILFDNKRSIDNLLCYLALRKNNIKSIQIGLAENGLSSLGRLEDSVLISIEQVLKHFNYAAIEDTILSKISYDEAQSVLSKRSKSLLGPSPKDRNTRIMVTLDIDTAYQPQLLEDLLKNGMDIVRINCAYNKSEEWKIIIDAIRNAESRINQRGQGSERKCMIVMDLAGPKIRIGEMRLESRPLKIAVPKNIDGKPLKMIEGYLDCDAKYTEKMCIPGDRSSFIVSIKGKKELINVNVGEKISFLDFRGRLRSMRVLERISENRIRVGVDKTMYLQEGITLHRKNDVCNISLLDDTNTLNIDNHNTKEGQRGFIVGPIRPRPIEFNIKSGDKLLIYKKNVQRYLTNGNNSIAISCTMPEILDKVQTGHRVLIDDGKIGSLVNSINDEYLELKITYPSDTIGKIKSNKGLNFPDSNLKLPAITAEDIENLKFIVKYANAVAVSFVHSHEDIKLLNKELLKLGYPDFGIIAKIETQNAVYNLSRIILAGLNASIFGILIARGDLAVEIGYENLSLIQEDILCLCEAAHIPVILATQVLESLAKSGLPTRAEIIDAARGQRAECVMLNKGKYIVDAVKILSLLLKTEERHNIKKRQIFRDFIEQYGVFDK